MTVSAGRPRCAVRRPGPTASQTPETEPLRDTGCRHGSGAVAVGERKAVVARLRTRPGSIVAPGWHAMTTALPACGSTIAHAAPEAAHTGAGHPCTLVAITVLASSMAFIDGSVVNVALPAIARTFADHAIGLSGSSAATCCR